jgi:soluble lytic murein transglycosylase-like protein
MPLMVAGRTGESQALGVAAPRRAGAAAWRVRARALVQWLRRWISRGWRSLGVKARFRIKVLAFVVLLTSPLWTLNLAVAFLGHSAIFPLSPFFLRAKLAALGSYARHRARCLSHPQDDVDRVVRDAEARHHVPRGLLAAVVHVESGGYAHRISAAGAMGPGQLMPDTAKSLGVEDPFDTVQNVDGAARLLARHLARFHRIRLAIAAYHAGPGVVRGHVPENGQTPGYVTRVMHTYAALRPHPARHRPGRPRPHEDVVKFSTSPR